MINWKKLLRACGIALLCSGLSIGFIFVFIYARFHPWLFWVMIIVAAFIALVGYIYDHLDT